MEINSKARNNCHRILAFLVLIMSSFQYASAQDETKENLFEFSNRRFDRLVDINYWNDKINSSYFDTIKGKVRIEQKEIPYLAPAIKIPTVIFSKRTLFFMNSFNRGADFSPCIFEDTCSFSHTNFEVSAQFNRTLFNSIAEFNGTQFYTDAYFINTIFRNKADFCSAEFRASANFSKAILPEAIFESVVFDSSVDFGGAMSGTFLDFHGATFKNRTTFNQMILPDSLDFRYVNLSTNIDLTYCRLRETGKKCKIALSGTDLNKVRITMELFELWFPEKYNLRSIMPFPPNLSAVSWSSLNEIPEHRTGTYELLLAKLKQDGFLKSYETVEKDYHKYLMENGGQLQKTIYHLNKWWWDFGYAKENVLWHSLELWGIISLLCMFCYKKMQSEVYRISFLEEKQRYVRHWHRRAIRNIIQVVAYTGFIFWGLKISPDAFQEGAARKHWFLFSCLILTYFSGLVFVGFLANWIFTG